MHLILHLYILPPALWSCSLCCFGFLLAYRLPRASIPPNYLFSSRTPFLMPRALSPFVLLRMVQRRRDYHMM